MRLRSTVSGSRREGRGTTMIRWVIAYPMEALVSTASWA